MKKESKEYNTRIDVIKDTFNLSDSDMNQIQQFLSRPELLRNKNVTIKHIIESVINTDELNDRQKIVLAYSIGMFQVERDIEKNIMSIVMPIDHTGKEFGFMKGG